MVVRKCPKVRELMPLFKIGVVFSVMILAPNAAGQIAKLLVNDKEYDYDPSYFRRAIRRLERREVISVREIGNQVEITLTDKGKNLALCYEVDNMLIEVQKNWDGKWRVIIFDVPETKRKHRDAFINKLKDLGFYQFQKSVYFLPHPCDKEIEFLRNYYGVAKETTYMVVERVEDDAYLRSKFGLN